jgi:hypothetical protein
MRRGASFACDLARLNGGDQRLRPIEARREALQLLVDGVKGIVFSEALAAEGCRVSATGWLRMSRAG